MCPVATRLNSQSSVDLEPPNLTVWLPRTLFRLPDRVLSCLNALEMPLFVTKDHLGKLTTIKKKAPRAEGHHLIFLTYPQWVVLTI